MSEDMAPLTPAEVRTLLRECVTVVGPGEVLVIRAGHVGDVTPAQMWELHRAINDYLASEAPGIKALVTIGDELGIITGEDAAPWLADVRIEVSRDIAGQSFKVTHLPAGYAATGETREQALGLLAQRLAADGHITVNDARAALGLEPFEFTTIRQSDPEGDSMTTTVPPIVQQYVVDLDLSRPRETARALGQRLLDLASDLEPGEYDVVSKDEAAAEANVCFAAESPAAPDDGLRTYDLVIRRPRGDGWTLFFPETVRACYYTTEPDGWLVFWARDGVRRAAAFRSEWVESVRES